MNMLKIFLMHVSLISYAALNGMDYSQNSLESGIAVKQACMSDDESVDESAKLHTSQEKQANADGLSDQMNILDDEQKRSDDLFYAEKQVKEGAQISAITQKSFHWAALNGHSDIVEKLLDRGAQIDAADVDGMPALHVATERGHREVVELLLDRGANIYAIAQFGNQDGITALHLASVHGHRTIVELLLDRKAEIDSVAQHGLTPLHCAAAFGHIKVVELLLDRGAQIEALNESGKTALYMAAEGGHKKVVALLLDRGAKIETAEPNSGRNALHTAVFAMLDKGHRDRGVVELLLDRNAQIDATDRYDSTALHHAVSDGHRDLIELLLDRGAQIGALTDGAWTALHHAVGFVNTRKPLRREIVELLLDRRAEIGVFNHNGQTVLHQAASSGIRENVELLVGRLMKKPSDEEVASACDQLRKIVLWEKIGRKLLHTRMPKDVLIYMVLLDESLWRNLAIILLRKIDHGLEIDTFFANEKVLSCAVQMILDAHDALLDHVYCSNLFYNADNRDLKPFFAPNERERSFSRLIVEGLKRSIAKSRQNQNVVKSSQELVPREDVT